MRVAVSGGQSEPRAAARAGGAEAGEERRNVAPGGRSERTLVHEMTHKLSSAAREQPVHQRRVAQVTRARSDCVHGPAQGVDVG